VAILWRGHEVARLGPGKNLLSPRVLLDRRLERVSERGKEAVIERLKLGCGTRSSARSGRCAAPAWPRRIRRAARVRSVLAMLVDEGGIVARDAVAKPLAGSTRAAAAITKLKVGSARSTCSCPTC
jgi:ATP-dependent RNA helicase SUPV3L1/SUV3